MVAGRSCQAPAQLVFAQRRAGLCQVVGNAFGSASAQPFSFRLSQLHPAQASGCSSLPTVSSRNRPKPKPTRCLRLCWLTALTAPRAMSVNLDKATFTWPGSRALSRSNEWAGAPSQVLAGRVKVEDAVVGPESMGARAERLKDRKVGTHFSTVGAGQARAEPYQVGSSEFLCLSLWLPLNVRACPERTSTTTTILS